MQSLFRSPSLALLVLPLALCLSACSGNSGGAGSFEVSNTVGSISRTEPVAMVVRGNLGVYFINENATGRGAIPMGSGVSLNTDLDFDDRVARVVDLTGRTDVLTGVAAVTAEILGNDVFLQVLENEDSIDWNTDGLADDAVLLHFNRQTNTSTYLATLNPNMRDLGMLVTGGRLYYSEAVGAQTGMQTSLRYIENGNPMVSNPVSNCVAGTPLMPILLGEKEGLIFLLLDETEVPMNFHNGDADMADASVLALLDGTDPSAQIISTGLAMRDKDEPFDAKRTGVGDWTVAFLVDEASEGIVSLNDQTNFTNPINVPSCVGMLDIDVADRILHFIEFASFMTASSMPVNTGLSGEGRVIALAGAVATLSLEPMGGCDQNEDGDDMDTFVRWTTTALPVAPNVSVAEMHPIKITLPGGSMGLSRLGTRLVAVIDEGAGIIDLDLLAANNDLVAWIDPNLGASAQWTFSHQSISNPNIGTGIFEDTNGDGVGDPGLGASEPYAGASWMAAEESFGRLGITFLESVPGANPQVGSLNTNLLCSFFQKDLDTADALPVWLDFEPGPILDFDGVGFATDMTNARVTTNASNAFFVVSEMYDNTNYNGDLDFTDKFLFRNPLFQCQPTLMSVASDLPGPALFTDNALGAMFYADEVQSGVDMNGDNDALDIVVRYFRF